MTQKKSRARASSASSGKRGARPEFVSTLAKDYVRSVIDRQIIDAFKKEHFPLGGMAFLGLTGEQLNDILSWREYFARWTAVQVANTPEDVEAADELERRILRNNLESNCQFLRANVDSLLVEPAHQTRLKWPYHVVNLDYYGGLINAAKDGSAARLDALRALFQRQEGHAFLLFLTISFRGDDAGEMEKVVSAEEADLAASGKNGVGDAFEQHRELGRPGLLKLYVPHFLASAAPRHRLKLPAILRYPGTIPMMHFAVECLPYTETQANRHLSLAERIEIVNRPLLILDHDAKKATLEFPQIS
jgi:hypothetical protein